MLMGILRWIIGYVEFEICGTDAHRFLTGVSVRGYRLWRMKKQRENCCSACIAVRYYRELHHIAKKRRLRLCVKKRHGLPFLLKKWRKSKKYGLFLGAICALIMLCVLSTRVWVIHVSGNENISTEEIRMVAADSGLKIGAHKNGYNPLAVENQLMLAFPELSWVTVNTWGSTVDIVILESEAKPEVEDTTAYGNVLASQSGQIISMDVYHGRALVKIGDGVAAGQLLVSGVQTFENGNVTFTKAAAKIMAHTRHTVTVTIPKEETSYRETGNRIKRKSLQIFGIPIPLTWQGIPEGNFEKATHYESLQLNGVDLPLTIYEETYMEQEAYLSPISETEAIKRGEKALREWAEETLKDGEILSNSRTITEEKNSYQLEWNCLCLENISREEPFFVELDEKSDAEEQEDR